MQTSRVELSVDVGRGTTVSVQDHGGAGPDVILLHGAGLNLALWDVLIPLLTADYRVVTLDFLGHGASSLPNSYSWHADLAAVEAVIETLGLDRPAIVGHSYGGILAVEYSATHPECPLVVNLDGHGGRGRPDHHASIDADDVTTYWNGRLAWIDSVVEDDDAGDGAWRDRKISHELTADAGVDSSPARAMVERGFQPVGDDAWEHRPPRKYMLRALSTVFGLHVFAAYTRARCPVIVAIAIQGRASEAEFAKYLDAYHEGLQQALSVNPFVRYTEVDSGHNVPLEQPGWVADLIRSNLPAPAARVATSAPDLPRSGVAAPP